MDSLSTPRKASKGPFETPSKHHLQQRHSIPRILNFHPSQLDPYDSPSSLRHLCSPSVHYQQSPLPPKNAVGPTPQRDGRVLGLFDLLSESGGSPATPAKKSMDKGLSREPDTIQEEEEGNADDVSRGDRSPASYSLENLFATPTTLRYAALVEDVNMPFQDSRNVNDNDRDAKTANGNTSPNETPSFLRRSSSNLASEGPNISPTAVRKPTPFVGKGLTALVKGLREMEKDRTQDDWDVLNEIEAEQRHGNVQVGDSQVQVGENASTTRPSKKKGQKRTTRRVKMKPVISKPKPRQAPLLNDDVESHDDDELAAIPETQDPHHNALENLTKGTMEQDEDRCAYASLPSSSSDIDSQLDFGDDSDDPEYADSEQKKKEKLQVAATSPKPDSNSKSCGQRAKASKTRPAEEKEKGKKPRARKVNAEAHTNYRSLKIRNKGSKRRFRRR